MNRIKQQSFKRSGAPKESSNRTDDFLWNFGSWLTNEDEFSDIIISSRIRLARNVKGYAFPGRAGTEELEKLIRKVQDLTKSELL